MYCIRHLLTSIWYSKITLFTNQQVNIHNTFITCNGVQKYHRSLNDRFGKRQLQNIYATGTVTAGLS